MSATNRVVRRIATIEATVARRNPPRIVVTTPPTDPVVTECGGFMVVTWDGEFLGGGTGWATVHLDDVQVGAIPPGGGQAFVHGAGDVTLEAAKWLL